MKEKRNTIALITGGSKGIGLGIAEAIVSLGGKVMITGRNANDLTEGREALNRISPGSAISLVTDVRDPDAMKSAVDATIQKWGKINLVVANAGVGYFKPVWEISPKEWNEVIETNLTGAFYTLRASFEALKNSRGYYITIASLAGTNFFANGSAYNASKFGLVGFTQAAMLDLRKHGIKVTTIMPGSVSSYFNNNEPSEEDAWKIQPEDIGQIVTDLLQINPRSLPSKIEVRPSQVPSI